MKKGFIEQILDDKVLIIYDDNSRELLDKALLPDFIKIDMVVEKEESNYTVKEKDENIQEQIKTVTEKIFKPFDPKNKKKRQK
ncbi:MAG: hypothetical protein PHT83_02280 [Bacilli bacterium]|nr:hypothetical protein [Bacilli bacterium]